MNLNSNSFRVFLLDDDLFELQEFERAAREEPVGVNLQIESFRTAVELESRLCASPKPDIVVLDINLGQDRESQGISLIEKVRKSAPQATVIMQSNLDRLRNIRDCLAKGADDFISKKTESSAVKLRILLSHQAAQAKRGLSSQTRQNTTKPAFAVGETATRLATRVPKIMKSAISAIHIHGESGTGKEIVADLFEHFVPEGVPFVRIHCGAINPQLMESELFGHKKGAFTGATGDRVGLIEVADNGYVFLDEVATLSPAAQVALLRVLEAKTIRPVGDTVSRTVSIKVISATNEDLRKLVEAGKFREDLLQRLCELKIDLPPLRDRPAEIRELLEHFARQMDGGPYQITSPTVEVLSAVSWKNGNIRELRNCLRAMTEFAMDKVLTPLCIPAAVWEELEESPEEEDAVITDVSDGDGPIKLNWKSGSVTYEDLADSLLLELIQRISDQSGKRSMRFIAGKLGIARSTLSDRLRNLVQRGKADGHGLGRWVNLGLDPNESQGASK